MVCSGVSAYDKFYCNSVWTVVYFRCEIELDCPIVFLGISTSHCFKYILCNNYRPRSSTRECNIFTRVCDSVHGESSTVHLIRGVGCVLSKGERQYPKQVTLLYPTKSDLEGRGRTGEGEGGCLTKWPYPLLARSDLEGEGEEEGEGCGPSCVIVCNVNELNCFYFHKSRK